MPRVTSSGPRRRRIKRVLKSVRGAHMARSKTFHAAHETFLRSGNYARAGRRLCKRDFRSLWITRITAACLAEDIQYSRLIHGLQLANIHLNRKMLSELAIHDPAAFSAVVAQAKAKLASA